MKKTGPNNRESLIREVTNESLKSQFIADVGQKAKVERSNIVNEHMDKLREVLTDIGQNLEEIGATPKGMTYVGSLSVHVYISEILKTAAFATLSETKKMPAALADAALRELTGNTMERYAKRRQKLRSGF